MTAPRSTAVTAVVENERTSIKTTASRLAMALRAPRSPIPKWYASISASTFACPSEARKRSLVSAVGASRWRDDSEPERAARTARLADELRFAEPPVSARGRLVLFDGERLVAARAEHRARSWLDDRRRRHVDGVRFGPSRREIDELVPSANELFVGDNGSSRNRSCSSGSLRASHLYGIRMGRSSFKHQSKGRAPTATSAGSCQLMFARPAAIGSGVPVAFQQY